MFYRRFCSLLVETEDPISCLIVEATSKEEALYKIEERFALEGGLFWGGDIQGPFDTHAKASEFPWSNLYSGLKVEDSSEW